MSAFKKSKISSFNFSTGSNGAFLATLMMGGMSSFASSLVESVVKVK